MNAPVIMIGTALQTMGGVSSVVRSYEEAGLLDKYEVVYISTHCDGNTLRKFSIALHALVLFMRYLVNPINFVHIHVASRGSFWRKSVFMTLSILARTPYLIHLHGAEFREFFGAECGPVRRRLIRYFFERAACVIVLSRSWRDWARVNFPESRVEILYNPVATGDSPNTGQSARSSASILFLGRLGQRKGTYDLVDAVSLLVNEFPSIRLLLAGDGELDEIRDYSETRGVAEHVEILGWIQPRERSRLLANATIYVLPSYNEGLPVSVLEAMASGLPIVSTPVGGIPEAVENNVHGFLVAPGDIEGLTEALRRLLVSPHLRTTMGDAAAQRAKAVFSIDVVIPQLERIYASIG